MSSLIALAADAPSWRWLALAAAVLAGLCFALSFVLWRRRAPGPATSESLDTLQGWAPEATRVLSAGELRAHALLVQALPQHLVLAQVPLARFVKVPLRNSYAEWLRRVGHLNADLLVCDAQSQVVAVVEVRRSRQRIPHRQARRQERFARVLQQVGIPLQVWTENALPRVDEVARSFSLPTASPPAPALPGFEMTQHLPADEGVDRREPPSSTWLDEFDSAALPLQPIQAPAPRNHPP